jgi:hypothetical protein
VSDIDKLGFGIVYDISGKDKPPPVEKKEQTLIVLNISAGSHSSFSSS